MKRLRPVAKKPSRAQVWALAREVAFAKYGRYCLRCGRGKEHGVVMQVHHVKPQGSNGRLRYRVENLVPLCKGCHAFGVHGTDARESAQIVESVVGTERLAVLDRMQSVSRRDRKPIDLGLEKLYLEGELKKLEGASRPHKGNPDRNPGKGPDAPRLAAPSERGEP